MTFLYTLTYLAIGALISMSFVTFSWANPWVYIIMILWPWIFIGIVCCFVLFVALVVITVEALIDKHHS